MIKIVVLTLALAGLQALPISRRPTHSRLPLGVQDVPLAEGFKQGIEPSRRAIVDLNTGLVQDYISETDRRTGFLSPPLGYGHGEMERRHQLTDNAIEEVPVQKNGGGWVRTEETLPIGFRQGTEPSRAIPEGFRQGTEAVMPIPDGFRQGTEPSLGLMDGFRQGTEPTNLIDYREAAQYFNNEQMNTIPARFRQGTEPTNPIDDQEVVLFSVEQVNTIPDGFRQGTEPSKWIPDGFRQGTERHLPLPDGFRQGTEPSLGIPDGFRQGTEPSKWLPDGFRQGTERHLPLPGGFRQGTEPSLGIPAGFRQGTEPVNPVDYRELAGSLKTEQVHKIPDGFRQGTEPSKWIPDGFRQGTERHLPLPDGFRQGTEPSLGIPDGFRQGTEPSKWIPDGFRQGTERHLPLPGGFRQGTEPSLGIPAGFRQGTEPVNPVDYRELAGSLKTEHVDTIPDGFRQGSEPTNPLNHKALSVEPSNHLLEGFRPGAGPFMPVRDGDRQDTQPLNPIQSNIARCNGEILNGRCYVFNSMPMPFLEAQDSCKSSAPNAELASVTDEDLHSRLVSMVTDGGQRDPVMTWLGGTVKNQWATWLDGSAWRYSDWMPGQPNIHTDKPVCVEMFRMDETWWTAADCDLSRASICSYPVVV